MQTVMRELQEKFLQSLSEGGDPPQVAEAAVALWRGIDAALSPIIAQQGVAALLSRSRYLVRSAHPWLAMSPSEISTAPALESLASALSSQPADEAVRGNVALLQIFHDLLVSLIGASLCERLLRPVHPSPSSGSAAQDPSS